jgi:hypothetical protein
MQPPTPVTSSHDFRDARCEGPGELAVSRYTSVPSAKVSASLTSTEVTDGAFDLYVRDGSVQLSDCPLPRR